MAIYVFNEAEDSSVIAQSLCNDSISRFGWSYDDSSDLRILQHKSWNEMSPDEISIWKKTNFLLNIKQGDWIIHVNTPAWGQCIAGEVLEEYFFDTDSTKEDFRHCITIKGETLIQFDRNANQIYPAVSRRLKLQGHYWRMYYEKEFFESIARLKDDGIQIKPTDSKGVHYLKSDIIPMLEELTCKIHDTHPEKKLEYLVCEIFKNVPNVIQVNVNGSGYGTDFGADVIVKYTSGLNILNLQQEETLVVQVKSYDGSHYEINCVDQLKTAIECFNADCGLLISTAKSTDMLEQAIDSLSKELNKPIALMAGVDVAKFLLKYEKGLLFDI